MLQRYTYGATVGSHTAGQGDRDVMTWNPADETVMVLRSITISNAGGIGMGEADELMLRWAVVRGHTTVGSGGTSQTSNIRPALSSTPTSSLAAFRVLDENIATGGTAETLYAGAFNLRLGKCLDFAPPPEMCPWTTQAAGLLVFRFLNDFASNFPFSFSAVWEEVAG